MDPYAPRMFSEEARGQGVRLSSPVGGRDRDPVPLKRESRTRERLSTRQGLRVRVQLAPMSTHPSSGLRDFIHSFTDVLRLPRAFWLIQFAFAVESMAYFGILTLMTTYLSADLGWPDAGAHIAVSFFTGCVTLFMLGFGSFAEGFGLRRAILAALALAGVGRLLYIFAPGLGSSGFVLVAVLASLAIVAIGEGILQPVCYSGVKQYTDEKTSAMGYALIYAFMNLGIVLMGFISAWVRTSVDRLHAEASTVGPITRFLLAPLSRSVASGLSAVNWTGTLITFLTLFLFALLMTRRVESAKIRPDRIEETRAVRRDPIVKRVKDYFTEGPFADPRFLFFIFMLLPVRTLFAHFNVTLSPYILRAYPQNVKDHMEWLTVGINSAVIVVGVPLLTALTRKVNVYHLMVVGSLITAAPTFLLAIDTNVYFLIAQVFFYSLGEALWTARFLEYASELAPEGRIAQYMGLASVPWLVAKMTTGFYSGFLLDHYCPANAPPDALHPETMWFIYACIAMTSPIGLWLARKWVMAGLHTKPASGSARS